jgi:predicted dehydrogenase
MRFRRAIATSASSTADDGGRPGGWVTFAGAGAVSAARPDRHLPSLMRSVGDFARRVRRAVRRVGGGMANERASLSSMRRPQDVPVLRCGVVGLGAMGRVHVDVLRQHPYFSVTAIASRGAEKEAVADELGCAWFASADAMLASGCVDVIVIATPHWLHSDAAIAALRSGVHVVCEKPLTVTPAQADAVLRAAAEGRGLLTVALQGRFEPIYQRAKALLESGELGPVQRCEMVETFWRSAAYYRSGAWRGTWRGEGGGVVLNQAAHVLDRYIWLCGLPMTVSGFCDTLLHAIEVEDTATAIMRHENGCHGWVHVNTTECPSLSRTVIVCDRGRIAIHDGVMKVERLAASIRSRTAADREFFGDMRGRELVMPERLIESPYELLARMYENIALAIARRQPLLVTAAEAASAVELADAILLSSARGSAVNLPLGRAAYDAFIRERLGSPAGLPASA